MAAGKAKAAWAARRALVEGAAATPELVAAACGLNARALGERAAREGWRVAGGTGPTRAERIARVHDRLLDRIEREQLRGEGGDAPLDKAGVAELAATARILAKISEVTRDEDGAKEKQPRRRGDVRHRAGIGRRAFLREPVMAANRRRGEISARIDGEERILCLTLGALAELESAFAVDDLAALAERFASGRLGARDLIRVVGAGLRGGGMKASDDEVAAMKAEGGAAGFAGIAAKLLSVTFGADPADEGVDADP